MNKIIDLFNTPQAELTYIDQFIMSLVWIVPLTIIMAIVYFIAEKRSK